MPQPPNQNAQRRTQLPNTEVNGRTKSQLGDLHGAPNTHKRQRGRDERPAKSLTAERKKRRQGPRRAQRLAAGKRQREKRKESR